MPNHTLSRWSRRLTPLLVLLLAFSVLGTARAQEMQEEIAITPPAHSGPVNVLVELREPPAAVIYGNTMRQNSTLARSAAQALAASAARQQIAAIQIEQHKLDANLARLPFVPREVYRVTKAYNGVAFLVDSSQVAALRKLPGIKAVHVIPLEFPTNSTSVPFLGVPNIWGNTIGLASGATGTGVRIGVIDTGIDYVHANFGGTGLLADYMAEQTNSSSFTTLGSFPPSGVSNIKGGTDLVGDAYNGSTTPVPDPNPMDCNGHGSHVAGTAAGLGVTGAGATYTGPYDNSAPFASFRIGPGVAPGASIYSIRVFGCTGGTGVVVQAIDWAMDPNQDNDLSDHLDVINMSLGSDNGSLNDSSAQAAENAAAAGVIVVTSAGNAGDTYYIVGSPSVSSRTISTAASVDSGVGGAVLTVNTPAAIAGNYAASAANSFAPTPAPNPTGQTATIVLALDAANASGPLTTDGCTALTNAAAVAGNIALIDRGTCGFQVKANNAQAAGAIGVIIANNVAGDPNLIALGATGTTPVTIPTIMISLADRNTIVAQLPANATLGAATAADTIGSFSSRGPRKGGSSLKPDIAAPGLNITSTQTGVCNSTCLRDSTTPNGTFIPGNLSLTISGTSMASPHMAGTMALLRQIHPDWSVEQLKALAMDYSLHDVTIGANGSGLKYGPGRIGSGRVDPPASAVGKVVALNDEDTGLVSVSFESTEVVSSATEVKKVRVINDGLTAATYDLSIATYVDAPGVTFSAPGTVTVPAGSSVTVDVTMNATASMMNHTREASVAPGQAAPAPLTALATLARHWLTEEAGYLVFSQSGTPKLHVPLYLTSRPASTMAAPATIPTGGNPTGSTTIPLSGQDVCTGTLGAGPTCTGSFPTTEESLVTPFELQVVSPQDESIAPPYADIQYAGVAYNAASNILMFGVSTWGDWSSPTDVSFNVFIDANSDGTYDRVLFSSNPGSMAQFLFGTVGATGQDTFITGVFNLATSGVATQQFINLVSSASVDSALFNNNVMFLAATPASLGLPVGTTKFKYKIVTCPGFSPLCLSTAGFDFDEANGPYTYDYAAANQGLNFNGSFLAQDLNGATLPVTWNTANMTTNGSLGALLLHHHNKSGQRAQTIALQGTATTDLALTKSVAPANPTFGQTATFTLTVTNTSTTAATGVQVTDLLPAGLTWVSDDSGGAYDPSLGAWTVGAVAASASATLHIVTTVDTTDQVCNKAQITAVTPLDTNPANNSSVVCVMAPRSADVAVTMTATASVMVGQPINYHITVTNNGSDTSYSLNLPAFTPTSNLPPSAGVFSGSTWIVPSLGKGFSETLDVTLTAPNIAGNLIKQVSVGSITSDPNNANNTATATTLVTSPATVTATKTVAGSFVVGGTVTYTVVLSNSSSFDQQDNPGHEFTDVLPSQLTLTGASATSGTATTSGNTAFWDGVVPGNGSVTITITATIKTGTALQAVSNQGSVSYDADGNGVNEATAMTDDPAVAGTSNPTSFVVSSPATIGTHSKTVSGTFQEGGTVIYTVTISNTSASDQQNNPGDEFTDVLPAGLTLVGATATTGTATADVPNHTVHWNGVIVGGGSVTITITAVINNGAGGTTISNQGTVFFDADGNGTNESSVVTDNPNVGGATDPTSFAVSSVAAVPTLSTVGLAFLALLLAGGALLALRRRRQA